MYVERAKSDLLSLRRRTLSSDLSMSKRNDDFLLGS